MKVTDIFTLYHRENPPAPAGRESGIRPVPEVERISLQPGQLFRGEVLGDDGKGHILLKIGDDIITTGGLLSMETGQKVWVEVKEVGDSPLFALAEAKGAIHELLKNIMEIRPAVLSQGKGVTAHPPAFQAPPPLPAVSFVPELPPLQSDGSLPRETLQLFKALLALPKTDIPPLPEVKQQQLAPFLSEESGRVDLRQVVSGLSRTGRIDPILRELAPLRPLFVFGSDGKQQGGSVLPPGEGQSPMPKDGRATAGVGGGGTSGKQGASATPVPFITAQGQVVAHVVQVVRGLIDAVPLLPQLADRQEQTSMEQLTKGFTDLLKSILTAGKIPEQLRNLEPVRQLLETGGPQIPGANATIKAVTAIELVEGFAKTAISGAPLSPVDHNETVAKILSSMQGPEPKPELLRVLKQLLAVSQGEAPAEDDWGSASKDQHSAKLRETLVGLASASSFFKAQALVSHEVAQVTRGDFVLVPCFFAGQSGWGEWLWSHEEGGKDEGQKDNPEKLAFFLEMSNLGPVSIQAILAEKTLSAKFRVAGDTAYRAIVLALPQLEERLKILGYKANFTCQQKPVAVMQEIKDTLESRTNGATPSSLVDVQA